MDFSIILAALVFATVYGMIIVRNVRGIHFPIWLTMSFGALSVLALNLISPENAYYAINFEMLAFLFGMFALVAGLETSGFLKYVTTKILARARTPNGIIFFILVVLGVLSAFLINDTIALAATPVVIGLATQMKIRPTPLLITLAFGITIGSMLTPIGNPQNLLISLGSGMDYPFLNFVLYLGGPTISCLFVTYFIIVKFYKKQLNSIVIPSSQITTVVEYPYLAKIPIITTVSVIVTFFALGITRSLGFETHIHFSHVALFGGLLLLAVSKQRKKIFAEINWKIIVFFMAMFVFMAAMWESQLIEILSSFLPPLNAGDDFSTMIGITVTSVSLSQVMSNVPFVAVYVPVMNSLGFDGQDTVFWITLAAASTLAGNLTILGAASNILIIEEAEKRNTRAFGFWEFLKIGSVVTVTNIAVLCVFLSMYLLL